MAREGATEIEELRRENEALRRENEALHRRVEQLEEHLIDDPITRRHEAMVETISSGVVVYEAVDDGEDFVILNFNASAERIDQVSRETVIGRLVTEVFPGVVAFGLLDVFREVLRSGQPMSHPVSFYEDNRCAGWRENYVYRLPSGEVVAVYDDRTEAKQAEEALRRSEELFRAIIEQSHEGIGLARPEDGRFLLVNEAFCAMTGYSEAELLERTVRDLIPPEINLELFDAAVTEGASGVGEAELPRADGSLFAAEVSVAAIASGEGRRILGVVRDISERKQAERDRLALESQIQQAQKLESLGVLAGGIAHDFNNLLVGVLGNAGLALLEMSPESPARGYLNLIEKTALRASEVVKQMLAYSGKGRFVVERIELRPLIEEMTHLLEVTVSKKVVLRYELGAEVPPIEADATQMRQVIMNLLTNASEAIGERSGVIVLTTGAMECDRAYLSETYLDDDLPEGLYSYIEVSDTGIGMDAELRGRIFDPFFSTKFTGRGLGLAAVLGIVRGHKGALKIYSEPGKGSTFKALFLASPGSFEALPPPKVKGTEHRGGTVLIVDDEETVRAVARRMLERLGYQVETAVDGKEAVEIFRKDPQRFDCVLLDLTMPRLDGEQCFRELRRIRKDVCVLLSSGYNEQELITRFAGKGLAGFIQKPFQIGYLAEKIAQAIQGRGGPSTEIDQEGEDP